MAEKAESGREQSEEAHEQNRTVWFAIVGLFIVFAVAGSLASSNSGSSVVEPGMRALIVPTADAPRTVVVAPCGTGTPVASANATAVMNTTGATSLELPQSASTRLVLVPKCSAGRGASAGTTALPSAAFVAAPGTGIPPVGSPAKSKSPQAAAPDSAQFHLAVPSPSSIRAILVTPCEKPKPSGPAEQILSAAGSSTTAVAPAC
jgi:hypothetical protein